MRRGGKLCDGALSDWTEVEGSKGNKFLFEVVTDYSCSVCWSRACQNGNSSLSQKKGCGP